MAHPHSRAARRSLTAAADYRKQARTATGHERRFLLQRHRAAIAIARDHNTIAMLVADTQIPGATSR